MIIGNNGQRNRTSFANHSKQIGTSHNPMPNSFENKWNKIQEYNQNRQINKNVFVKDIKEQKYTSATDTIGMQDKTLAMLHERLKKGTITLDEFNQKCAQLGKQRQNLNNKKNLF